MSFRLSDLGVSVGEKLLRTFEILESIDDFDLGATTS